MAKYKGLWLTAQERRKVALAHNRSHNKIKNYHRLVREYGKAEGKKITTLASSLSIEKAQTMRRRKAKRILRSRGYSSSALKRRLGQEMRELGYTGSLSDYPTVKDRKDWIAGAAPYRYDLKDNPAHMSEGALLAVGTVLGYIASTRF